MAATLGVPTLGYLPYAFLNLLNPVVAIIYGIFNIRIRPAEPGQTPVVDEPTARRN
jgi:NhaC family Na+:H+ antiporter